MSKSVIAAFPATGKTALAARDDRFVDSDSSRFSWGTPGVRNPNWPANYIAHIRAALASGERVLVSTLGEVRAALASDDIPFTLVYPRADLREEYRERMQQRGSPEALVRKVIDELWDAALAECAAQTRCEHLVLGPGEFLASVLDRDRECLTCGGYGDDPDADCLDSKSACGHHCNCSWTQDSCCWCGVRFGGDDERSQHVVHLPSGNKGYARLPVGDNARVEWEGDWTSAVDHMDLRTLPAGRRL